MVCLDTPIFFAKSSCVNPKMALCTFIKKEVCLSIIFNFRYLCHCTTRLLINKHSTTKYYNACYDYSNLALFNLVFEKMCSRWHFKLKNAVALFYSNNAAINSATQAGFAAFLISMVQEKVTLIPLLSKSSIFLTVVCILN